MRHTIRLMSAPVSFGSLVSKILTSPLGQHPAWVLIALAKTSDRNWCSKASQSGIAFLARLGVTATKVALLDLMDAGLVERESGSGHGAPNRYRIVVERLDGLNAAAGAGPVDVGDDTTSPRGGDPLAAGRRPKHLRSRARPSFDLYYDLFSTCRR